MSARDEVLSNYDFLCAIFETIDDDDVEVMGRAAASWCTLNWMHRRVKCCAGSPWGILVARAARKMPAQVRENHWWRNRVDNFPNRQTFYELCSLARLQRTGVPRALTRTPFELFFFGDGADRWGRIEVAQFKRRERGGLEFTEAHGELWLSQAWDRTCALERGVYHVQSRANYRSLGFDWLYCPLPGVRKLG
tara:strand:- start:301 stop:879 length:579 start_codon:yes stop_codon:yes gene_type:complete